jgi:D-serine deaminase-like pyridoxal phosphate-dependent protein
VHELDLPTPALVIDAARFEANLATMADAHPGPRLRPHVKAHKCTALAREQAHRGHRGFTCATPLEVVGMARAGLGVDLLLANETVDPDRLRAMAEAPDAIVTVAVDSDATVEAAAAAGIRHVLIDVDIGLPRCGCRVDDAGRLADLARAKGMDVRGVMGYEGHLMMVLDRVEQRAKVAACVDKLMVAHAAVGGPVISGGGTGTYDLHDRLTEVQAGSYALMDTHYAKLGLPFGQALSILGTVISSSADWAVADVGLKSLGMDHGNPSMEGYAVRFCSDEHVTFTRLDDGAALPKVGDRVRVWPAHVDPTMALHERAHLVRDGDVIETWAIDLRGW